MYVNLVIQVKIRKRNYSEYTNSMTSQKKII